MYVYSVILLLFNRLRVSSWSSKSSSLLNYNLGLVTINPKTMVCHNENSNRGFSKKEFDITESERASLKECFEKLRKQNEADEDYEWFLGNLAEVEDKDENDDDPQYVEFLKNLSENGKSYKLAVFKNNEISHYIKYEEHEEDEELDGHDPISCEYDNNGDKEHSGEIQRKANGKEVDVSEVPNRNKNNKHKSLEPGYEMLLNAYQLDNYGAYDLEGRLVKYEDKATTSYDSDIQILENRDDFTEVEDVNRPAPAKKESLKEKLIHILEKPYSKKEYAQLSKYFEEKKPICRLLPLRQRAVSSALEVEGKSVLDDAPGRFRMKLEAAKRAGQRPKALNLMRMFCFWLENLPNEDVFRPWLDEVCLKVLPPPCTK